MPCTIQGACRFSYLDGLQPALKCLLPNLVAEWLRVKDDPLMRQTFINTTLGEPYEDAGEFAMSEQR
ncbi:terminase gpA endonuclease subunit [Escherichia coli]|uniref:terminase gpA endonuclease subunit n=1 Tax=Escherichia coli TaxID=562 RepID=UPI0039A69F18